MARHGYVNWKDIEEEYVLVGMQPYNLVAHVVYLAHGGGVFIHVHELVLIQINILTYQQRYICPMDSYVLAF